MSGPSDEAYEALVQFLYRTPIGLAQTTMEGAIEMVNPMSAQLLMPLSEDGSLDNLFTVLRYVAPDLRAQVQAMGDRCGIVCESVRLTLDTAQGGSSGPEVLSLSLMKIDPGRLMAVLADATHDVRRERQQLARRLSDAAKVDALTQMPNRTAILEHLQRLMAAGTDRTPEFAVLFLNCDRLEQINDSLGREAGDQVLGQMSIRLRSALRQSDSVGRPPGAGQMAARVGGDEFVVVLQGLRWPDDVYSVAERLLTRLAQPYAVGAQQVHCSLSMGIVPGMLAAPDASDLLQDASIAMAEAKRGGGARYVAFDPAMRQRAVSRGAIESDLRRAVLEQQLFVVYQPVVGLCRTGPVDRSSGVEALVRWRHPTRGVVPPFEFIGVAEECGLIGPIGDYVLEEACRQLAAWHATLGAASPRRVAVNLSRAQLRPGFEERVQQILARSGIAPQQLQLEVTESLAAQDESIQAQLHALKSLGLTLALDDFGTGYSSLASLHLLPVDTVKIDRSFVSKADSSEHHRVLIDATVRVARSLGMSTVAEGVETEAQHETVRDLGCDRGQGYLYSRPLLAADVETWVRG